MNLTKEERQRFMEWLAREIYMEQGILKQLEKLPGMGVMLGIREAEVRSMEVVLNKLRNTHSETI